MSTQRYVPITQGFNDDPEAWELTDTFGDRSIRLWIEILRIMEESGNQWRQVDGWSASLSRKVRQSPAKVRLIVGWMVAKGWLIVGQESANDSPAILKTRNYAKFHDRRKTVKTATLDSDVVPLPILSEPSEPNLKEDTLVNSDRLTSFAQDWNFTFSDRLPTVRLPLSEPRKRKLRLRLTEHPDEEFWNTVFTNIGQSKFLLGNGNQGWKCTFDFIIENESNCLKIEEGQYAKGKEN